MVSDDDVDLIDSIYLTSKYPIGSVLPDYIPNEALCKECLAAAYAVRDSLSSIL
ncbi:hypothetical protein [Nitratifractor salsuginis]|uniref:hypothetical protein n=1 Tax=Nitratifractor salsuginis TaxID=269261 RepID=UPI00145F9C92|nr:hypothetical protein [Nitratifractor salsuginis]